MHGSHGFRSPISAVCCIKYVRTVLRDLFSQFVLWLALVWEFEAIRDFILGTRDYLAEWLPLAREFLGHQGRSKLSWSLALMTFLMRVTGTEII